MSSRLVKATLSVLIASTIWFLTQEKDLTWQLSHGASDAIYYLATLNINEFFFQVHDGQLRLFVENGPTPALVPWHYAQRVAILLKITEYIELELSRELIPYYSRAIFLTFYIVILNLAFDKLNKNFFYFVILSLPTIFLCSTFSALISDLLICSFALASVVLCLHKKYFTMIISIILMSTAKQNWILIMPFLIYLAYSKRDHISFRNKIFFFLGLAFAVSINIGTTHFANSYGGPITDLAANIDFRWMLDESVSLKHLILFLGGIFFFLLPSVFYTGVISVQRQVFDQVFVMSMLILILPIVIQPLLGGPINIGYNNAARQVGLLVPAIAFSLIWYSYRTKKIVFKRLVNERWMLIGNLLILVGSLICMSVTPFGFLSLLLTIKLILVILVIYIYWLILILIKFRFYSHER